MSYIVPKEIPNRCGRCPCFHAEHPMYCQAVKADKNKRIYAPYGEGRPDWCPLIEVPTPHGRLIDADALIADLVKYQNTLDPESRENARVLSVKSYLTLAIGEAIIEAEE